MYARVLRFDVGFGRPELAERIAAETQTAMSRWPGFQSMQLLADYLGGRYTLVSYWDDDRHLYDFSYSADSKQLEDLIDGLMMKVPYVGTYAVYQPGSGERRAPSDEKDGRRRAGDGTRYPTTRPPD